jgi:hypothetical protein
MDGKDKKNTMRFQLQQNTRGHNFHTNTNQKKSRVSFFFLEHEHMKYYLCLNTICLIRYQYNTMNPAMW